MSDAARGRSKFDFSHLTGSGIHDAVVAGLPTWRAAWRQFNARGAAPHQQPAIARAAYDAATDAEARRIAFASGGADADAFRERRRANAPGEPASAPGPGIQTPTGTARLPQPGSIVARFIAAARRRRGEIE